MAANPAGGKARGGLFAKNWDRYVAQTDELARSEAFLELRDVIIDQADPRAGDHAIDVGTGTGLLALPLAERAEWVWALDISPAMVDCVRRRAREGGLFNLKAVLGSATRLPLDDASVDVAVSNYCFHHLSADDKRQALAELHRVLAPGGRLAFGDMMLELSVGDRRSRAIILGKVRTLLRRGPAGALRLTRAAARTLAGVGEKPASPEWWRQALTDAGFVGVEIDLLRNESGVALARKPLTARVEARPGQRVGTAFLPTTRNHGGRVRRPRPSPVHRRRRRAVVAGSLILAVTASGAIALGSDEADSTAGPSAGGATAPIRLVEGGRTLATRPTARLDGHGAIDRLVASVPGQNVEHRGRATITKRTDRAALARLVRQTVASGGGTVAVPQRAVAASIRLPVVQQALHNNCETAALSMLLLDRGKRVDQLTLQSQVAHNGPLTPLPPPGGSGPDVWGDPARGFVGSAAGNGFGVYQRPIAALARSHGVALHDLTGKSPEAIYRALLAGHPVMAWVALSSGPYETWRTESGRIVNANFGEHTVVLTGIDGDSIQVNDPLSGQRLTWTKAQFEQMWAALGHRALAA